LEKNMTIDRKILGNIANTGQQLTVTEFWLPGEISSATNGWIKKQLGVSKFLVVNPNTSNEGIVVLQNSTLTAAGQARIAVVPSGNGSGAVLSPRYRALSGTVAAGGSGYAVNDTLTVTGGVVLTVATVNGGGAILTFTVTTKGNVTNIPADPVTPTGTSGAGVNATVNLTWEVNTVTISNGGTGYTAANVVFSGGTSNATGTATITSGVVTGITVATRGSYEANGTAVITTVGTTEYLKSLQYRKAITFNGNSYIWDKNETADEVGEANVDFS
jgi:hypothetical protein